MSQADHQMEQEQKLHGSADPTLDGGFLYIKKNNGQVVGTVTVPPFNLNADSYEDSLETNDDSFEDSGNIYTIDVSSSRTGIEWNLNITVSEGNNYDELVEEIEFEFKEEN